MCAQVLCSLHCTATLVRRELRAELQKNQWDGERPVTYDKAWRMEVSVWRGATWCECDNLESGRKAQEECTLGVCCQEERAKERGEVRGTSPFLLPSWQSPGVRKRPQGGIQRCPLWGTEVNTNAATGWLHLWLKYHGSQRLATPQDRMWSLG